MPKKNPSLPSAADYVNMVMKKTSNDESLAKSLFEKLFFELPIQAEEIQYALEKQDISTAYQIAHKLHGSVGFCGLANIQLPAYLLEVCLLGQDTSNAQLLLLNLQSQINHLIKAQTPIFNILNGQ